MWLQFSEEDITRIAAALVVANLTEPEKSTQIRERLDEALKLAQDPTNQDWIEKAGELHGSESNGREIDGDATVSRSDEGAYVMMWGWVSNSDMGLDEEDDEDLCRTCGEEYAQGGDGFDGECPDCADKTDQKINPENYTDCTLPHSNT